MVTYSFHEIEMEHNMGKLENETIDLSFDFRAKYVTKNMLFLFYPIVIDYKDFTVQCVEPLPQRQSFD